MVVSEEIKSRISEMGKRRELALVILFGSRARGDAFKGSDIDIAYSSIKPMDLREENEMAVELHEIFKTSDVDIANIANASPLLLRLITRDGIALYEAKESVFNELYLYALKIFREAKVLFDIREKYVKHQIDKYKKDILYAG